MEATDCDVAVNVIEKLPGPVPDSLRSALLVLEGHHAMRLATAWQGVLQWTCASRLRPGHGRKNWYFGGAVYQPPADPPSGEVRFETMRASGAGGQHVNKTESAVRATHVASGISVRVESERSQHANRRLALALLARRLELQATERQDALKAERRLFHHRIERGNPVRVFVGEGFVCRA